MIPLIAFLRQRGRLLVLLGLALVGPGLSFLQAAPTVVRSFDVPAGPAEATLGSFSAQAEVQFVYADDKVRGVRTRAVKGELTVRAALDRMFEGTELYAVEDPASGAVTVNRRPPAAAHGTTGVIEGRVFGVAAGTYLNNALVTIPEHQLETLTDPHGNFRFARVPVGEAVVRASYTGAPAETQAVTVAEGRSTVVNFRLRPNSRAATDGAIVLDAFTVAANREMTAADLAVNEQRFASSIKSVVSTDTFGDIAEGNVGEFVKFLPGVTVNRDGNDGRSISIGGVPASSTPITIDGNAVASASSSNPTRVVELEQISINNMSRVEINRSQNPDNPAAAIGGSVNLVSKSAFERARPQYTLKAYAAFREGDLSFDKKPGPLGGTSHLVQPNLEVGAIVPVNDHFGFAISGINSRVITNSQAISQDWVPHVTATSANFPATTADRPYLARFRIGDNPKLNVRQSMGLTMDYRLPNSDVITLGMQYSYFYAAWWGRTFVIDAGRVTTFDRDFTQGAAGAGFATIGYGGRDKRGTTAMPSFRYQHNGDVWKLEAGGAFSRATNHYRDIDKGFWQASTAALRNVTVRFDGLGYIRPETISLRDAAGQPVDAYSVNNYSLESGSANQYDAVDTVRSLYGNARREFNGPVRLTVKAGADLRSQQRDIMRPIHSFTYLGADGLARTTDDNAAQWFDPIYASTTHPAGIPRVPWLDLAAIGTTFRDHPGYFSYTEAQEVSDYRTRVNTSQAITEDIYAPYLRLDARFFGDRLTVTGGARYERTVTHGVGGLIDPARIYQRDASGRIVRNAQNQPVVIAPLASLAGTKLAYVERGARTDRSYGDLFPSVNAAWQFRPNLIGRLSYASSIARPDFGNILPSANVPDSTGSARLITITNPALAPWTAASYGASLEYYFDEPSSGVLSVRAFQRNIKDFWGAVTTPATDEFLQAYGLDPAIYGAAQGYMVSTRVNTGDARVSGFEVDYRQNLNFLPEVARGFTLFGNLTSQHLEGSSIADFSEFVRETINYGLAFSRSRFTARVSVNLRGLQRGLAITTAGAEPGTYTYFLPRRSLDVTGEFRLTKNFSVYAGGRNANGAYDDTAIYGPNTPRYSILRIRADYRAYWNVGLKGVF